VILLAAKERQQRIEKNEELEAAEEKQIHRQEHLIQELEQLIHGLRGRFARLRRRSRRPPV
jgi:hypothetical protein